MSKQWWTHLRSFRCSCGEGRGIIGAVCAVLWAVVVVVVVWWWGNITGEAGKEGSVNEKKEPSEVKYKEKQRKTKLDKRKNRKNVFFLFEATAAVFRVGTYSTVRYCRYIRRRKVYLWRAFYTYILLGGILSVFPVEDGGN